MTTRLAIAAASFAFLAAPALAETPPIEKIAPENSVLVIGARNTAQAMDNIKKTGLWALWQSDKMKSMTADAMKQMDEGMKKMMQDLGVEEDSLTCPTGAVGLALFTVTDPDLGTPEMAVMTYADYGESADKTDKLIHAALDKGQKDGKLEIDEKDIGGHQVFVIDLSKMEPKADEANPPAAMGGLPLPDPSEMLKGLSKVNYVRSGSTLLICSDLAALTDALETIDGKGDAAGGGKFAQREDFRNTVAQVGGEGDVYAVLLTRDIMNVVSAAAGAEGQLLGMLVPTVRALVGKVGGYAMGVRFDSAGAMIEDTLGVYMPDGKKGLSELIDKPSQRADIPGFVGADSISYMTANFDFSGVMGVIKNVIKSDPMLAGKGQQVLDQIEPTMTPILNALGSRIVVAGGKTNGVSAVECKDAQSFENAFAGFAAQAGLESRDFLGQRIYTMKEGMAGMLPMGGPSDPISIGIGGGFVFFGSTPGVEQSLRATGQKDAPTLAKDATFQRALGALSKEPLVAWGYSDTIASIDQVMKAQQTAMKKAIEDAKEFDPDMAAEMEKQMAESGKMMQDFDPAFLKRYIGPSVWQVRSTDKGFVMTGYLLPAEKN